MTIIEKVKTITFIIVTYNEEQYIERALMSAIQQDYPKDLYEIIVVDGMSHDKTLEIIKRIVAEHPDRRIRIFDNPKKILSAGWNIAIKEAWGEVVVRIDAHAYAAPDFVSKSVEVLNKTPDAVCVGGPYASTIGADSLMGTAIASALSCPFGVGNSKFRYSHKAQYVETVPHGAYRKEIFEKVKYFDETLRRNQDIDMHARIRDAGGKFFLTPEIKSWYCSRTNLRKVIKQMFANGYWNILTFMKNPAALSMRHLVPFVFLLFLIAGSFTALAGGWSWMIWRVIFGLYFLLNVVFSLKVGISSKIVLLPILLIVFPVIHISYGCGSLYALKDVRKVNDSILTLSQEVAIKPLK